MISTDHISVALQILQGPGRDDARPKGVDVSVFVASPIFSTSSEFVGTAISEAMQDEGLRKDYERALEQAWRDHPPRMTEKGLQGMSAENAQHIALSEVIRQNRAKFPPQGFVITTQLGDGASISTIVPALGAPRPSPASEPGRKAEGAPTAPNTAFASAQSAIVSALVLNGKG